ncbi:prepilin-type N-terminal cleavage/methylation domain-containing protein [Lederbergia citrea]|uniref:Prepilin-type N-terminal cleavage/methylation domain-containing protein n=1 Tax=Lederbergia citrea TaxID=2833581 RepID=A0A942Z4H0_9BACI|nr:prepilin-type N-terminal cleavage/methylation domain-containing protein [Lederbergia citrea]MBS4177848.1 prepilin-type N-terminal cleavage/methylation domain-containing protein [Lederbergia citrea]MBS4204522.1 prepilin-type N-terminal cleavage/methylation domain-containing protein [Lederbergia citrea]MBS4223634.1 prepilin-type N-terminal cleavage/methylation domain-containing protein [Lederbergia citrea]
MLAKCRAKTDNRGMTLIEVLLSMVILSIVIVTFLTMFIQSAKTNKHSGDIIDATYMAQTHMENIYQISTNNSYDKGLEKLVDEGKFTKKTTTTFTKRDKGFYISIELVSPKDQDYVGKVLVKVFNHPADTKPAAQMESRILWKEEK